MEKNKIVILAVCLVVLILFNILIFFNLNSNKSDSDLSAENGVNYTFNDDFLSYEEGRCFSDGEKFGPWSLEYSGYGCVSMERNREKFLHESPMKSTENSETHASLVLGPYFSTAIDNLRYEVRMQTQEQLRENPNTWEMAWAIWHYTDDEHFYYFVMKPNGWELGKEDPRYTGNQRFMATGSLPKYEIGKWYNIMIIQENSNTIKVFMDGALIVEYTDEETPYNSGKIGLYNEDAHVHFDDVKAALFK